MSTQSREERSEIAVTSTEHEQLARDQPSKEAQKSYHTVLEQHIQQALEDLERPASGLLLSSFSGGMDLGFGPFLMAVSATLMHGVFSRPVHEVVVAAAYTVGFIFVVVGRSALFTEQTTSAVLPVLARRTGVTRLFRLWALVLTGNLLGAATIALFIAMLGPAMGIIRPEALSEIANKLLHHPWWIVLLSAIAAGWLMGLLAWLVVASRETLSQIVLVIITTFVIGIANLHHSIAGSIEILMALFAGVGPNFLDYARFAVVAILGNAIGGAVFVALLKFGHVRASLDVDA
jgi:formate/nitrite transporter FocA (FNT family)